MKKKIYLVAITVIVLFVLSSVRWTASNAQETKGAATIDPIRQNSFEGLIGSAAKTGSVRVIVRLNMGFSAEGRLSEAGVKKQRFEIKNLQRNFLDGIKLSRTSEVKYFDYIPFLAFEADIQDLERMRNDPLVSGIEEDVIGEAALAESTSIVGAQSAWTSGYSGSGQTVVIIDSGVDKNHSFLAGKIISEACYSSNIAGSSTSVCPAGVTESTVSGSGLHCPDSVNGCAHGTNVAGIAAGRGAAFSGVAKDANIIAIQIFSRFDSAATCGGTAPCGRYWTSDLIKGLERVRTLSNTVSNIAAVNLSLQTGQQFTANCDVSHAATKAAIDNLRSVGIPTVICSGNYSFTNALTAPACISTSISVGSVDDGSLGTTANVVSSFSDSSSLLHLLAPGRWINSSIPNNVFQNYSGTSMAAPHVVGAFAILKQRAPNASTAKILQALTLTGQPITDSRNGIVKPRIRIDQALNAVVINSFFDYDADVRADLSVWRQSDGNWYVLRGTAGYMVMTFGVPGDLLAPADYDGDAKTDIAVFRPSSGTWFMFNSGSQTFTTVGWGANGDVPVPADHDGDGKADLVVFRQSTGQWFTRFANGTFSTVGFGVAGDKPVVGDFDGDGKADIAVWRPSDNNWYILKTGFGFFVQTWGAAGDIPVPADYDGDGKTDVAVFRPSTGQWFRIQSTAGFDTVGWGVNGDKPIPADYDGDGKADVAVFRPSNGTWYIVGSTAGIIQNAFGQNGDLPTQGAFIY
jgi:subtilisin